MQADADEDSAEALDQRISKIQEDIKYAQSVPEPRREAIFGGQYETKLADFRAELDKLQERKRSTKSLAVQVQAATRFERKKSAA
eukprot:7098785-Karenia_brevis.AAC.1